MRANYSDYPQDIHATLVPLENFFDNLLLNKRHDLKKRSLHVDFEKVDKSNDDRSMSADTPKCRNCTLDCTLEELAILRQLSLHPQMTQKELARVIGRSERTIKTRTVELQERGLLSRENGKRNGNWVVLADLEYGEG